MPKSFATSDRADVYTRITSEIIAAIEAGAGEWRLPWHHNGAATTRPINVASSRCYRGINRLALWVAAMSAGYARGRWGTYRAWQTVGAQVRKGQKSTTVVLWKEAHSRTEDDIGDEHQDRSRMFARAFSVFNEQQVDGYCSPLLAEAGLSQAERLPHAESFIANLGIETIFGAANAFYLPTADVVHMPSFETFVDAASFYGCWIHECGHASGSKSRLDRDLSGRFGSSAYAAEECVAEILSGLILADLGVAHHPRPDHAAYISTWLEKLKDDPRAIFSAANKAQQAADWMHVQQLQA
jgi:antirestriction protein ArdC